LRLKRNGLPYDRIGPTERQIAQNIVVIPKGFIDANPGIDWRGSFPVRFLGQEIVHKRLDSEHRISLPLRGTVPGTVYRLVAEGVALVIVG
jgi:hypothetical protein